MTETQSMFLLRASKFGWIVKKIEMIGRKLFVVIEKPRTSGEQNVFLDESMVGTVGPLGKLELQYEQFSYREQVTESYQLDNRLKGF